MIRMTQRTTRSFRCIPFASASSRRASFYPHVERLGGTRLSTVAVSTPASKSTTDPTPPSTGMPPQIVNRDKKKTRQWIKGAAIVAGGVIVLTGVAFHGIWYAEDPYTAKGMPSGVRALPGNTVTVLHALDKALRGRSYEDVNMWYLDSDPRPDEINYNIDRSHCKHLEVTGWNAGTQVVGRTHE